MRLLPRRRREEGEATKEAAATMASHHEASGAPHRIGSLWKARWSCYYSVARPHDEMGGGGFDLEGVGGRGVGKGGIPVVGCRVGDQGGRVRTEETTGTGHARQRNVM